MRLILVPGLWLDASSWSEVVPGLEAAGHRAHPLTLPGLESADADRSRVSLADQVAAVVAAIDQSPADTAVALVGHSLGCGLASIALDQRVDRVTRVIYIGGWPSPAGEPLAGGFATDGADLPMPELASFDDADLAGFDEAGLAELRERAIPSPARLTIDEAVLSDERRYDVPATMICSEYTGDQLREWVASGLEPVSELAKLREVEYVDLPTGHWPQLTRPADLAGVILQAVDRGR